MSALKKCFFLCLAFLRQQPAKCLPLCIFTYYRIIPYKRAVREDSVGGAFIRGGGGGRLLGIIYGKSIFCIYLSSNNNRLSALACLYFHFNQYFACNFLETTTSQVRLSLFFSFE